VVDTSTPDLTRHETAGGGDQGTAAPVYPQVTVCVVAHNPGAWFDEVLGSLITQDYPSLDVVVVDAASAEPVAARVHAVMAEATVVPLLANQGFAKNANTILDHNGLGPYLLICHDDVALAPDCIRRLVEEATRSNAGIVGPKLLDWDDPNRILHVGFGADKTGLVSDLAEPGEYDQEQHDAVRDVFAVPGAATLLRTDLFTALGGFDEGMLVQGEDLDLCWRAHALGARVIVNPAATARHREDLSTRIVGADRNRFARRHRIRSMLSNYGPFHTLRVVPQAVLASLIYMVIALFQGRIGRINDIGAAWWWNLRRFSQIRRRRKALAQVRQVSDAEVRALQVRGFEGIHAWRRGRADRDGEEIVDPTDPAQVSAASERRRWFQAAVLVWAAVITVLLFGSRSLIGSGLPVFNEFTTFPDGPSPLLTEWGSTWRATGVGAEAPSSLLHALLGLGGIALFGQMGLLRLLVTVGMLGVGAVGAYRLLQPFRSLPAQLVALMIYVAVPLPYNALHGGSWSGLVAYGAMPWIARRLAIAAGIPPFGDDDARLPRRIADTVQVAMITAAATLVEPLIGASLALLAIGWILGGLATRRVVGLGRLVLVTLGAIVAGFVMLMPASLGLVLGNADWMLIGGTRSTAATELSVSELFRFATGPHGATAVGWAVLILPALSLVLAFGQRLAWAARCWIIIVGSVGLAWLGEQADLEVAIADPHVLLAPAAMSLAFAAGLATMAFQRDLRRYRFGWRQLVPFVAVVAVVSSAGAGLGGALDGRWQAVDDGYESVFSFFDGTAPAHARALWIGDADVLPVEGWRYDDDLTFALTPARTPTILDHAVGNVDETTTEVRDVFAETLSGASSRLGQRLALYGVRYIVVVEANAPAPFSSIERVVDPVLTSRLTEQLDLVRVEVRPGATIYENQAYVPMVSFFPPGILTETRPGTAPANFALALPEVTSLRSYRGPTQAGELYASLPAATNWSLRIDDQVQERLRIFGWSQLFIADRPGVAVLEHQNQSSYWFASIAQLISWGVIATALILGRRRRS
jgi:GT2 family glycosyltransferase